MSDLTKDTIEQIKADAIRLTQQRLSDDGIDFHALRNAEVNGMEGVAAATPVSQAALANPSDPGQANFQDEVTHTGPKNTHASNTGSPTTSEETSTAQANNSGKNTTQNSDKGNKS